MPRVDPRPAPRSRPASAWWAVLVLVVVASVGTEFVLSHTVPAAPSLDGLARTAALRGPAGVVVLCGLLRALLRRLDARLPPVPPAHPRPSRHGPATRRVSPATAGMRPGGVRIDLCVPNVWGLTRRRELDNCRMTTAGS